MVAADADTVPLAHPFRTVHRRATDDPEIGLRWDSPLLLSDVLLEYVRLNCPSKILRLQTLSLCNANIHRSQNRRGSIDRHTSTHLLQRYAFENNLHVLQRAHRHTAASHLSLGPLTVGVIPVEPWHVESDAETRLSMFQQVV